MRTTAIRTCKDHSITGNLETFQCLRFHTCQPSATPPITKGRHIHLLIKILTTAIATHVYRILKPGKCLSTPHWTTAASYTSQIDNSDPNVGDPSRGRHQNIYSRSTTTRDNHDHQHYTTQYDSKLSTATHQPNKTALTHPPVIPYPDATSPQTPR